MEVRFHYDENEDCYKSYINGIEFKCFDVNDRYLDYAITLASMYEDVSYDIVELLLESDEFYTYYNIDNHNLLASKLNKPSIYLINEDNGILIYSNHQLDEDHIIEIEFKGNFDEFNDNIRIL